MMKKTLIALAVCSTAATYAHASELYNKDGTTLSIGGRAEARMTVENGKSSDDSKARVNLSGKTQVSDDLYGIGFFEEEFTSNDGTTGDTTTNRKAYAGFGGSFGEVTYGKNSGSLGMVSDFTDIMSIYGDSAASKLKTADRIDNLLTYKGQFDNLTVKGDYRFADRVKPADGDNISDFGDNHISGYSAAAKYAIGDTGLAVGAGYAHQDASNATIVQNNTNAVGNDTNQVMLAASYQVNDFYLAALYTNKHLDKANNYNGYELSTSYNLGKTSLLATYNYAKTDHADSASQDYLALEANYHFKPNLKGYVSYKVNFLDDKKASVSKTDADDSFGAGLKYTF